MDGGDNETRRRGACDLLRSMCKHYEEPTTRICSVFVTGMYQEYSVNREANWRSKDAAVRFYLRPPPPLSRSLSLSLSLSPSLSLSTSLCVFLELASNSINDWPMKIRRQSQGG